MRTHNGVKVIWCGALRPHDLDGKAPARYRYAIPGTEKAPGLYGEGFGGEVIVGLYADDDGQWFRDLCKQRDPKSEWEIYFHDPAAQSKEAVSA